jgi:drug/metabolite transporter (DMT)-like permease
MSAAIQMISGGAILLVAATLHGEWNAFDPARISLRSAVALGYLVSFGSIVALSAYVWLLRQVSVTAVSTYAFVNPVVAVYVGWALGREPLGFRLLVASALIVGAVVLVHSALRRAAAAAPPVSRPRGRWRLPRLLLARRYEP